MFLRAAIGPRAALWEPMSYRNLRSGRLHNAPNRPTQQGGKRESVALLRNLHQRNAMQSLRKGQMVSLIFCNVKMCFFDLKLKTWKHSSLQWFSVLYLMSMTCLNRIQSSLTSKKRLSCVSESSNPKEGSTWAAERRGWADPLSQATPITAHRRENSLSQNAPIIEDYFGGLRFNRSYHQNDCTMKKVPLICRGRHAV